MDLTVGQLNLVSSDIVTEQLQAAWTRFAQVTGSTTHYLAGGAPRDLILGEQPNDWDVFLPDMSDNSAVMLQHQLLAHYDFRSTKGDEAEAKELPEIRDKDKNVYDIFFDGVPFQVRSLGYFQIGDYNFNVISMSGNLDVEMLIRSFDWDFCQVAYKPNKLIGYSTVVAAVAARTIRFTHIVFQSTDAVRLCLERGRKFEQRFGLLMHPEDIWELEAQLPEKIELETELIRGYRLYDIGSDDKGSVLIGIARVPWPGPSMEASHSKYQNADTSPEAKNMCVQHLLGYGSECMCGINVFKDLPEPQYFFSHQYLAETVVHGVVAEYEHGYRAQFGRINQLWALYATLREYQNAVLNPPLDHIALAKRYGVPIMPMTRVMALEMLVDAGAKFTKFWDGRQIGLDGRIGESRKLMDAYKIDMNNLKVEY